LLQIDHYLAVRLLSAVLFVLLAFPISASASSYSDVLEQLRGQQSHTSLTVRTSPVEVGGIPRGATRVVLLPLHLQASCGADVRVWRIRLQLTGLGDAQDVNRVYLLRGFRRLHRPVKINSNDREVMIRLRNLVIPACRSVRLDVAVDFDREAAVGGQFYFEIPSEDDLFSTASETVGNFPIRTVPSRSSITPQPVGQVTIKFLPISSIRPIQNELLAKFRIKADMEANQLFRSITLTNKGTAKNDDLRNLYLTRLNGRALTPIATKMDGDSVTLLFSNPYFIKRGQTVLFQLRGNAYTRRKTVNFTLEEPSDLASDSSRRGTRRW